MGLFGRKRKGGVRGTARVISVRHAPHATHGSLRMTIVVEAPGVPASSQEYKQFAARVDKWPSPGDVLPVTVDPDDPSDIDVLWDEIPTAIEAAERDAERLAAMLRGDAGAPPGQWAPGFGPSPGAAGGSPADAMPGMDVAGVSDMVGQLQQMFPGAVVNVDTGSGPVDPAAPPPPAGGPPVNVVASQSGGDPVERLEKLARLRDAGVVDQQQFEQLRAQILEQAGLDD